MIVKFAKPTLGYKADQEVELEDTEANDLITNGKAVKVEAKAEDVVTKAADALVKHCDNRIDDLEKRVAKAFSSKTPSIHVGSSEVEKDPACGFKSFGHFAKDVVAFSTHQEPSETFKLYMKSVTGNTSAAAPDAGPTIPVQYTGDIFKASPGSPDLMGMTFQIPTSTNTIKIPVLKNYDRTNSNPANGLVAYVVGEAAQKTQSRTNWEQVSLTLGKLAVLVPVSDEVLLDNIVSLDAILAEHAAYQIRKACNKAVLNGLSGIGTGIIDHAATISVARETAGSVTFLDVMNMYSRFDHDGSYDSAVWLVSPTTLPKLAALVSGGYNVYMPPGGATAKPFSTLLGRPIIVTGHSAVLGTAGDVVLADLKKMVTATRGGIQAAQSIHMFFDTDETAFRFVLRTYTKPGISGPTTLEDGVTTVSPFVQLDDAET